MGLQGVGQGAGCVIQDVSVVVVVVVVVARQDLAWWCGWCGAMASLAHALCRVRRTTTACRDSASAALPCPQVTG